MNPGESSRSYSSVWENSVFFSQSMLDSSSCWAAGRNSAGEWMAMDLGGPLEVAGITIQARKYLRAQCDQTSGTSNPCQYVTEVSVQISTSADSTYTTVPGRYFPDSTSSNQKWSFLYFDMPVVARHVKIIVHAWNNHISMRAGVILKQSLIHCSNS